MNPKIVAAFLLVIGVTAAQAEVPENEAAADEMNSKKEIDASLARREEVLTRMRAVPHLENGQPQGWIRVDDSESGAVYQQLQVRDAGIVTVPNDTDNP